MTLVMVVVFHYFFFLSTSKFCTIVNVLDAIQYNPSAVGNENDANAAGHNNGYGLMFEYGCSI